MSKFGQNWLSISWDIPLYWNLDKCQGHRFPGQMSLRQLPTNTDSPTNQPLRFGWVLSSNIRDMALYVFINYKDHNYKKKFANPVVDIAASSRIGVLFGLASWQVGAGLQSNWLAELGKKWQIRFVFFWYWKNWLK